MVEGTTGKDVQTMWAEASGCAALGRRRLEIIGFKSVSPLQTWSINWCHWEFIVSFNGLKWGRKLKYRRTWDLSVRIRTLDTTWMSSPSNKGEDKYWDNQLTARLHFFFLLAEVFGLSPLYSDLDSVFTILFLHLHYRFHRIRSVSRDLRAFILRVSDFTDFQLPILSR